MAKIHGLPGEWARVKGVVMGLWPLFAWIFASGFFLAMMMFGETLAAVGAMAFVITSALGLWTFRQGLRRVESFFKGAKGEERVAAILQDLPDEYEVFHDYVAGGDHVDHVVLAPSGLYVLETKFWNGKVTVEDGCVLVDGKLPSRSPVAQVQRETQELKQKLKEMGWSGYIAPVLTFASDTFEPGRAELHDVSILNAAELKAWFASRVSILTRMELDRISKLMES